MSRNKAKKQAHNARMRAARVAKMGKGANRIKKRFKNPFLSTRFALKDQASVSVAVAVAVGLDQPPRTVGMGLTAATQGKCSVFVIDLDPPI